MDKKKCTTYSLAATISYRREYWRIQFVGRHGAGMLCVVFNVLKLDY